MKVEPCFVKQIWRFLKQIKPFNSLNNIIASILATCNHDYLFLVVSAEPQEIILIQQWKNCVGNNKISLFCKMCFVNLLFNVQFLNVCGRLVMASKFDIEWVN